MSHTSDPNTLTVRSTEEVLSEIERLLQQYDRPPAAVRLRFRLIEADGFATADPALADVEPALRQVLRYDGYRLVTQTVLRSIERSGWVSQTLHESAGAYQIRALVHEVRETSVTLEAVLARLGDDALLLNASVSLPPGETVVLGTAKPDPNRGALILVVQADVAESAPASPAPTPSP